MTLQADMQVADAEFLSHPPVEAISGALDCGVLFICDHASNALPAEYGDLGLSPGHFTRHIVYDIGAADVTRRLAAHFGAPALLTTTSRLLIDPNRGADDPTLVMRLSDGAIVPGNARIDAAEIARRRRLYWQPYRDAIGATIAAMRKAGPVPAIVSMHSFTPYWKETARPWQVGILWDSDGRLAQPLIESLQHEPGLIVGDNEPYDGALPGDTLDDEVTAHGIAGALVEVRQDLVADEAGCAKWAEILARALTPVLAQADVHEIRFFRSRTGRHGSL